MSAISTKQAKEEKLWQSVQEMLEEQKYPVHLDQNVYIYIS